MTQQKQENSQNMTQQKQENSPKDDSTKTRKQSKR